MGKVEHALRAWGPFCSWHGQEWQPNPAWAPLGRTTHECGTACIATRPGASKELVMVGNRSPVVEGHHSLVNCFTNLPTITARYITTPPDSPKPFV